MEPVPIRTSTPTNCTAPVMKYWSCAAKNASESANRAVELASPFATSGKPSPWLQLGRLVKQALQEGKDNHKHSCKKTWCFHGFEKSHGASGSSPDHFKLSPMTPGHCLGDTGSMLVASIVRHVPSLISRLGTAPAQSHVHGQRRPFW